MPDTAFTFASPRTLRWVFVATVVLTFVHLFERSFYHPEAPIDIERSSFDWSTLSPHFPVASLEPLPTQAPHKLRRIQYVFGKPHHYDIGVEYARCKAVRAVAEKSWTGYRQRELGPSERATSQITLHDPFSPCAATLIDSLDTLWIMDMKKEFEEAVRVIAQIDWSSTSRRAIEILETTTRYLGGLLSAYDLSKEASLLAKAQELGDMLYMAFDTPSHMPSFWLDLEKAKNGQLVAEKNQPAASATGLFLEFTRLSQVTQNAKYYDAVARIVNVLHDWQNLTKVAGMWPSYFDLQDTTFNHDNVFSLGASSGVTYENIVKMYALLGGTDSRYEEMYRSASEAIVRTLLFRPMTPRKLDVVFPGTFRVANKEPLDPEIQHLACFAGGMFALAGKILNITEHVNLGARLTNGCMWTHKAFPHGVMPEAFTMVPCELDGCKWDETRWQKSIEDNTYEGREDLPMGFVSARDPSYTLRPEAIESMFILYRITGHQEYRDNAWKIFQEIQKATETDDGNRVAADVTTKGKLQQREFSESYWLSGTLKYLYLMFSAPEVISLDDYVLSTGGHPFRIPKR